MYRYLQYRQRCVLQHVWRYVTPPQPLPYLRGGRGYNRVRNSQRARLQPRVRHTPVLVDAHARSCESSSRVGPHNFFLAAAPIPMVKTVFQGRTNGLPPKAKSMPRQYPLPPKAKSMPRQYTTRLETDEEAYNRITHCSGRTSMSWCELRHIQDRAREARNRELSEEALKKKAEELKQRLLRSSLCRQARQKEKELKAEAKRMPRRMNACDFAPTRVSPARASAPAHVCPWKQYKFHVCAPDCVNWVACPTTGEPIRVNQIDCVQGYGNTSSDEDLD